MDLTEKDISKETIFKGKILNLEKHYVELPNKQISSREVVIHPGAVAVLPIDNEGNIYLVKQFRFPIKRVLIEIPAGKFDSAEENPLECGKRELEEEVGMKAKKWEYMGYIYTTPGFSNEKIHLYSATDLIDVGANPDEDEFVEILKVKANEIEQMIRNGQITDSKTICAFYMYKLSKNTED
ncbi:NUDIX domain-containing protein [Petrotoga sp. 9PWA.NaAc.5.4]|uniref:NUDIX domain-containing protein n=1 Tax=Petrotoga sp. 9PWA.NaAc.5.4 TaxID=1434328 RepID=UPI000CC44961|nr:NUDIX hydrolase [Petrotoga sp. 9PWA.NaAc.5.4]PNR94561.1 ADP-ribose pyrophosphatase [Petrotoga sp. 9PWA.NaAc.5.4]